MHWTPTPGRIGQANPATHWTYGRHIGHATLRHIGHSPLPIRTTTPLMHWSYHLRDALDRPTEQHIGPANHIGHTTTLTTHLITLKLYQLHILTTPCHQCFLLSLYLDVLKPHVGPAPRPLANVLPPRLVPRDPVGFEYCNTRFIKEHKPSNHIRARIKSHVYTTE